jgi:hypothetical protein
MPQSKWRFVVVPPTERGKKWHWQLIYGDNAIFTSRGLNSREAARLAAAGELEDFKRAILVA